MHEWMTVIDAAIQGVPEQARRRLRTVTEQFSVRRAGENKRRSQSPLDRHSLSSQESLLETLDERGLDLNSCEDPSFIADDGAAGATGTVNKE